MRAALLVLALLAGCSTVDPEREPGRSAVGPVFLVHGIWPDREGWWIDEMVVALRKRDLEAIPIPYGTFVTGYVFDYGTVGPADRLAELERELRARHAKTACVVPLKLNAVGFSAGTAIIMMAAERGARFERVQFAGSPIPFYSERLARQLREDRIRRLVNYRSLFDLMVYPFLGIGAFGYEPDGPIAERVENRRHWGFHIPPWTGHVGRERVVADLSALATDGARHGCFDDKAFKAWYMRAREAARE